MLAIQAAPTLWACTMSTRSAAISFSSVCALRLSLSGLAVAFTSGTHSPPNALSSDASGPSSAATSARAPDCSSAAATVSAARAAGSSRKAGTICKMVAPAKVRGGACVSSLSLLTELISSAATGLNPAGCACIQWQHAAKTRHGPTCDTNTPPSPKPDPTNDRSLPEILERWNRYGGSSHRCPGARGCAPGTVLARGLQVRHERHQGAGTRLMGAGPWPRHDPLGLFRPRRVRGRFHRRHHRPVARRKPGGVRCLLPRSAGGDRLVHGRVARFAACAGAGAAHAEGPELSLPCAGRAGGRLYRRADVEALPAGDQARDRADRRVGAPVAIFRPTLSHYPRPDRGGPQSPPARQHDRNR